MSVPIQNIYYLLSYAWDKADLQLYPQTVGSEAAENITNLVAGMLLPEVQLLLMQGLASGYISQTRQIRGLKGKLMLSETFRLNQQNTFGQTICAVEELSPDILPNQIIKATLLQLQQTADLAPTLKRKVQAFLPLFASIQAIPPALEKNLIVPLPRYQTARYRFVLNCCTFIQQNLLPLNGGAEFDLKAFLADKKQMAVIFEAFVRNFYRREQAVFQVKSERINWKSTEITEEAKSFLPVMVTDISLQSATCKIIIDTKFYRKAVLPHYQKEKLHSKHIYQLLAYLQNSPVMHSGQMIEGMLLYPVVNKELNLEYTLNGNKVRICTINLNQPWANIKLDLLRLLA